MHVLGVNRWSLLLLRVIGVSGIVNIVTCSTLLSSTVVSASVGSVGRVVGACDEDCGEVSVSLLVDGGVTAE